jgi:LETM1 and EF-hand domain-containing protein 1
MEKQLFNKTVADVFKVVPFAVLVTIPLMEFTIPIWLYLFPNMLPFTFEKTEYRNQLNKKKLDLRLKLAKLFHGASEKILMNDLKDQMDEAHLKELLYKFQNNEYLTNTEIMVLGTILKDYFKLNNLSNSKLKLLLSIIMFLHMVLNGKVY